MKDKKYILTEEKYAAAFGTGWNDYAEAAALYAALTQGEDESRCLPAACFLQAWAIDHMTRGALFGRMRELLADWREQTAALDACFVRPFAEVEQEKLGIWLVVRHAFATKGAAFIDEQWVEILYHNH